jgi:hypothetical protein
VTASAKQAMNAVESSVGADVIAHPMHNASKMLLPTWLPANTSRRIRNTENGNNVYTSKKTWLSFQDDQQGNATTPMMPMMKENTHSNVQVHVPITG